MIDFLKRGPRALRRSAVQLGSLLALHSSWGPDVKWLCNPVLTCHSCALSWFACPIGVLTHYAGYRVFPYLLAATLLLIGVAAGRLLCGWVCPFGFLQDLLHRIPTRKIRLPRWSNVLKYVVLGALVILLPFMLGEQTVYSFCRVVCPASALQVILPRLFTLGLAALTLTAALKLTILVGVLALCILSSRAFCRVLCPIGALMAPFNLFSLWRVRRPAGDCRTCGQCDRACPTDARPSQRIRRHEDPSRALDCVSCGECGRGCPHGANSLVRPVS